MGSHMHLFAAEAAPTGGGYLFSEARRPHNPVLSQLKERHREPGNT
jgi:hypothetical protein